jgi:hypothetical protein
LLTFDPIHFGLIERRVEIFIQRVIRQPRIDRLAADETRLTLVNDAEAIFKPHARRLLADDVMRQPMQCAHAIFVERLKGLSKNV